MDQLISLAGNATEGFEVVKNFINPSNLQQLIELSVQTSIRNQVLIQKIMQRIIQLDLPKQIYDQAV